MQYIRFPCVQKYLDKLFMVLPYHFGLDDSNLLVFNFRGHISKRFKDVLVGMQNHSKVFQACAA